MLGEGRRYLSAVPGAGFKKGLIIAAGEGGGFIRLDKRTFSASFTAGADFQNKRDVSSAGTHSFAQGLNHAAFFDFDTTVGRMIFNRKRGGNNAGAECRGLFLFIADAARLRRLFRAETGGFAYSFAACLSRAFRRTVGSSLPRAEALRRIPRQAF